MILLSKAEQEKERKEVINNASYNISDANEIGSITEYLTIQSAIFEI